jgi:hypothetical protein
VTIQKFIPGKLLILSLLLTVLVFALHFTPNSNSMLNTPDGDIDQEYIASVIEYHKQGHPAFARRPLFTMAVENISLLTGFPIGTVFVVLQFVLIFCGGLLFSKLSMHFSRNIAVTAVNLLVYFLTFSNLLPFFSPVYTYDEPLQFIFILASIYLLYIDKQWWFVLLFALALIARESSLLLIPGILVLMLPSDFYKLRPKGFWVNWGSWVIKFSISVLIYALFLVFFIWFNKLGDASQSDLTHRFEHFLGNFRDIHYATESVVSFILILAIPLYLFFDLYQSKTMVEQRYKSHITAFLLTVLLNSIVVILTTKARETRLFVLPLFFLWPVFYQIFQTRLALLFRIENYVKLLKNRIITGLLLLFNLFNLIFSFIFYRTTVGNGGADYFNEYLFAVLFLISLHVALSRVSQPVQNVKAPTVG